MKISRLRANHLDRPLGYDFSTLALTWVPESDKAQKAVWSRVRVAADAALGNVLHDSGKKPLDSPPKPTEPTRLWARSS